MNEQDLIKKDSKVIIGDEEYPVEEDMSIDELLEIARENPAYAGATKDNVYVDENGNVEICQPKSKTQG